MPRWTLLAAAILIACSGDPKGSEADPDADGDGFPASEDCDDQEAAVNPTGAEVCDGLDNNCDGAIDDSDPALSGGTTAFHADADADGYGDPGTEVQACLAPAGMVVDSSDCDDADEAVNPGAEETCDGVDSNCSGDESDGVNDSTWYADADGDHHGDPALSSQACEPPAGYVEGNAEDCDDTNIEVHPGAVETCDGVDTNCSGDESDATDLPTWYADHDGDGYGNLVIPEASCEAPSGYVDNAEDCDDHASGVHPGVEETCDGEDSNCSGDESDATDPRNLYPDGDGDGYGAGEPVAIGCSPAAGQSLTEDDCDDADPAISPGAAETCDGVDSNCSGDEDDASDALTLYADADLDGHGDPDAPTGRACEEGEGWALVGDDCDDSSSGAYPGAEEVCDGIDNNCVDGEADVALLPTWYADEDLDGFGDPTTAVDSCTPPTGSVSDAGDCDDAEATVHDYAWEDPSDAVDNDCDGAADGADADLPGQIDLSDDDAAFVDLNSLAVPFCGESWTAFYVSSNGRLTFGASSTAANENSSSLLNAASPPSINPFWDDLNPAAASSDGVYLLEHSDAVSIYFQEVVEYGRSTTNTAAITIRADGRFLIQYAGVAMTDGLAGWSCAVGSSVAESNLSAMARSAAGYATIGQGTEDALYEYFTGSDNDLDHLALWYCGSPSVDMDGDGWVAGCGDPNDEDADLVP